jgi:flavodoxin
MSKVLIVYYTYSQQTGKAADAMAEALQAHGHEVTKALIGFTDHQYGEHFSHWPMNWPVWNIVRMLPAQKRRKTGNIAIPPQARDGDYDLVIVGSPTWWLTTNMPVRSYLKDPAAKQVLSGKPFAAFTTSRRYWKGNIADVRELGETAGGQWEGQTHFVSDGNQVMSMWSWLAFMRHAEERERSFGKKLPKPNLKPDYKTQARRFADDLADRVLARPQTASA